MDTHMLKDIESMNIHKDFEAREITITIKYGGDGLSIARAIEKLFDFHAQNSDKPER